MKTNLTEAPKLTREQLALASIVQTLETVERFKRAEPTEGNLSGLRYWKRVLNKEIASAREIVDSWPVYNTEEDGTVTLIRAALAQAK